MAGAGDDLKRMPPTVPLISFAQGGARCGAVNVIERSRRARTTAACAMVVFCVWTTTAHGSLAVSVSAITSTF
jgi:hypothetical protein